MRWYEASMASSSCLDCGILQRVQLVRDTALAMAAQEVLGRSGERTLSGRKATDRPHAHKSSI